MQLEIINFDVFLLGTIFIVILPGPNSLFVLTATANRGISAGYRATLGIIVGDTLLMLASVVGVAGLMRSFPPLFISLKLAGALYLAWLGFNLMLAGIEKFNAKINNKYLSLMVKIGFTIKLLLSFKRNNNNDIKNIKTKTSNDFVMALILSLSNPKAILFFIAFFVQFVDINATNLFASFMILGVVVQIISIIYLTILIVSGAYLASWFTRNYYLSATGVFLAGIMFMIFSYQLSIASL